MKLAFAIIILILIAGCKNSPNQQTDVVNVAAQEIKQQISQISPDLIRHPSIDEVRREEFTNLPAPDWAATSLPREAIKGIMDDEKERYITDYIKEELSPRVEKFTAKWNVEFANFETLDSAGKTTKMTDMDRELASLEKIDNRFQTVVLKARLQKIREFISKIQLSLAGI
jgi:uncharacterized protein (DUF2164 family)